ncbi:hypothetical protein DAPPUDRAFT_325620 [Daphnia pulex]|uniref:Uncharacterized protein n=1 Tax=Daphnia pulex TaxID=6669 RepID=E9H5A6_DAPPU|nr:hypothetical protein DAPPUDRAFT_325620 [Daphnia pulex]|eukprot:EFX73111.1 hypothetical protein DAPPUDRAFT_325620 [Daphnia pulex]
MGKKVEIIQFKELNANKRIDEDFLSYSSDRNDNTEDNHFIDLVNPSPLFLFSYPIIKGFALESMHTLDHGAFGRAITGLAYEKKEGKLDVNSLRKVDHRIKLFAKCKPYEFERKLRILSSNAKQYKHHEQRDMLLYYLFPVFKGILSKEKLENVLLLQYFKLLMGGFEPKPVPEADLVEARRVSRLYNQQQMDSKIPIRPMTHAIIHMPMTVKTFKSSLKVYVPTFLKILCVSSETYLLLATCHLNN